MLKRKMTKIIIAVVCIVALITPYAMPSLAVIKDTDASVKIDILPDHGGKEPSGELTDEEKAEFEAKKLEMQEKMKTEFQEKLSKGEITQEEYDTFIENLENGKIGCPMEWKRKIGVFKCENNEENKEAWQFKMMKKIGEKVHAFKKKTSEQE